MHLFIDFYPFIHENQGCFAAGANSTRDYDGLWILTVFDDGQCAGSFRPAPVVLVIASLFHVEQLFIGEEGAGPLLTCSPTLKLTASLESYAHVVIGEKLNFLEVVWFEFEFLFGPSPHISVSRPIFLMEVFGLRAIRFLMSFRLEEVLTVRFVPLPGRRPSWSSSLYRLIARRTFARSIPSERTISQLLFSSPCYAKICARWFDISKQNTK